MLEFATKGKNDMALKSRQIAGNIKSGNVKVIERLIHHIKNLPGEHPIKKMFDQAVLVPAPRSAPIVENGLWPTKILCEHFVESGLGKSVQEFIVRETKVPKSSNFSSADLRPSCNTHFNSLTVIPPEAFIEKIVVVDDVFTLGRTSCACVRKLKESFPDADISVFAVMRTRGFVETLDAIVKPSFNSMTYHSESDTIILPD
ncbi:MAG: hypothetical protein NXH90_01955 [Flavobacteriaceae bacterium]|nr:hypothetical protein [Flavobacteriaceae bacterium]